MPRSCWLSRCVAGFQRGGRVSPRVYGSYTPWRERERSKREKIYYGSDVLFSGP